MLVNFFFERNVKKKKNKQTNKIKSLGPQTPLVQKNHDKRQNHVEVKNQI